LEQAAREVVRSFCAASAGCYASTAQDAPALVVVPVAALRPGCAMSAQFLGLDMQEVETLKCIQERT
jgi:hypothetical protein